MRRAAAGALLAMALAGCADFFTPAQPDWIVNRQPLESCGVEEISANGLGVNVDARTCLLTAFQSGDGAELISTRPTEEGDPITSYYRVHENGTIELFVDATRDRFGARTWERYSCGTLASAEDMNPDLANEDRVFIELDCVPLPVP